MTQVMGPRDFVLNSLNNFLIHPVSTLPAAGNEGRMVTLTTTHTLYFDNGTNWVSAGALYSAGNGLSLYSDEFAVKLKSSGGLKFYTGEVAADFGSAAGKVTQGNDSRLSDSRAPNGSAGGDLTGTYPSPTIGSSKVTMAKLAADTKDQAAGTSSLRKIGTGATDVIAGNDSRMINSRTPTTHAASHKSGGGDAVTLTAAQISNLAAVVKAYRLDEFAVPAANVSMGSKKITNLYGGTDPYDVVNYSQLQAAQSGMSFKNPVRVATTINGIVGTMLKPGEKIDNVTLVAGDRVLVKDQVTASTNGIWVSQSFPVRADDAADSDPGSLRGGSFVFVDEGDVNQDTGWVVTTDGLITPGGTPHNWAIFSRAGELTAGDGLTKTGAEIKVNASVARIVSGRINGLTDPASAQDAATKAYVDKYKPKRYVVVVGDGASHTDTVYHDFGTRDIIVSCRRNSTPYDQVEIHNEATTPNSVKFDFGAYVPSIGEFLVTIEDVRAIA